MSIHDGHRQRLKQRFLEEGLESFTDIQVLELLLFFSVPRQDTNPIAHALLDHFGSLYQVLEAPVDSLIVLAETLERVEEDDMEEMDKDGGGAAEGQGRGRTVGTAAQPHERRGAVLSG